MKKLGIVIGLLVICLTVFITCKKDPEVNIEEFEIATEELTVGPTSASIVGTYSYPGKIEGIKAFVADNESFAHAKSFDAELEGTTFTIEITDLKVATTYHYYYSIDYGFSNPFKTEAKTFATLSESPTVRTLDALPLDSITYRIKCEVVSGGGQDVTERGICWNTFGDPTLEDETLKNEQTGLGQYTLRMENLDWATTYYVRAYAKNATGIGFGDVLEFRTGTEVVLPQVSTVEVNAVTSNGATCVGNVSSDGGTTLDECGVCWGTASNPSLNGNHQAVAQPALGVFSVSISGLNPNRTYYVRCYASNVKGTAYGEELTFTTTEGLPVVTTTGITNITPTSAKGGGNVTDEGASSVTERGICWGTGHNPTISGNHASSGTGAGSYTVSMTNLTPNATYYVRAYATNAQGTSYGSEVNFTALEGLSEVTTQEVSDITATSAKGHGTVTDQGGSTVTERGICWSVEPSPTIANSHANSGTGVGNFTVNITSLTPGTKYYVRAYAINTQGTTYGDQKEFTTGANLPTVTTSAPTDVAQTTATGRGEVTNDGGSTVIERGICWSTSHNPTIDDSHGSSGTGTGTFSVNITGLTPGTTYYLRAYAVNSEGTAYGNEVSMATSADKPTVTTGAVSNITQTTALGSGNVTSDGGASVTERGICWSTSHNPTTSSSHASNGSGTGGYTVDIAGLTANTTYYVRAYATNSQGTSYGNEVNFTTAETVSAPSVTTGQVTNIAQISATGNGEVTADGGATVTERGVCWSTSHNPTTSGSHANSGAGTGTYTVNMTGLTPNATYYVRAYAINSVGTSYGSEVSFATLPAITVPTVITNEVTNIQQTTAIGGGNVTNSGGATVTEYGLCWGTSHNPTTSGSHFNSGIGMGAFTVNMIGLTANTTYYVRAYATNSAGTAYGVEVNFTTLGGGETYEYVDLGLPSGTLWATCNVGANTPEENGYYFAWGETTPKTTYDWITYMYCMGSVNTLTKYCNNPDYGYNGYVDNLTTLLPEDDAATANWGDSWCMPTYDQWLELRQNTTFYCTTQNGVNGALFTATNGNSLFLPATGLLWDNELQFIGNDGYFWSSSLRSIDQNDAMGFHIDSGGCGMHAYSRSYGLPVRPVRSTSVNYAIGVSANPTNGGTVSGGGTYQQGQSCTVTASANFGFTFTNWTENGNVVSSNASYSFTVTGNRTLVANFQASAPTGAINGLFSVSTNQQVYFSQGNLQYQASSNTWRFATNQYDCVGSANSNISQTYNGWIDLFGWGTSGYNHGAVCYQPWSTSETYSDYYAYGSDTYNLYDQTGQADWGFNSISNGGNQTNPWRTLTNDEWEYVFNARTTLTGFRYAKARVNNVNGVILLPDNWSASYYTLSNTNMSSASFSSNTITASQWTTLEQYGAVFLPAAGGRFGTLINYVGSGGYYWSASYNYNVRVYILGFGDSHLDPQTHDSRNVGHSVRLVKNF